jgi:uncharacterized protein YndB with AHSA1/START domain
MSKAEAATIHRGTTITADPDVPAIRIVREFDATPDKVLRAHTDPDVLVKWLGPRDVDMEVDYWDCRTGGSYRYLHRREGADGPEEYAFHGCFHEVRADRMVQTFTYEGYPDGVSLETLILEDLAGGGTRLTVTSIVESFEARDMILASGMEAGVVEGYEQLDEVLVQESEA